jgi:hypothetical protein
MCLWGLSIPSLGKYATPTAVLFNLDVIYSSQDQQTFKPIVLAANEIYIKDRYFIVNTDPDSPFIIRKFATLTSPPVLSV